ncbi:MAG: tetratricopeptide repeat protein [Bacteroidia bacterium]
MESPEEFDLIENYLEGLLDAPDANAVESRIASDPVFADKVNKHRAAHVALKAGAGIYLKERLQEESEKKPRNGIVWHTWYWAVAAAVTLLAIIIGFRYTKTFYTDEYIAQYYATPYGAGSSRGEVRQDDFWAPGMQAFNAGEYEMAATLLDKIPLKDSHYLEAQLLLGNAYVLSGNYEKAQAPLKLVAESGDSRFVAAAEWYLLLALVGSHEEADAEILAAKLSSEESHPYRKSATKVARNLRSMFR